MLPVRWIDQHKLTTWARPTAQGMSKITKNVTADDASLKLDHCLLYAARTHKPENL